MLPAFHARTTRLRRGALLFGLGWCFWQGGLVCPLRADAGDAADSKPFEIIARRNIFAPHPKPAPEKRKSPSQPAVVERLVLVGILSYERGDFAFFNASRPELQKVLQVGESVEGCTLMEIALQEVKLKAGTSEFTVPVGAGLIRKNGGAWRPGGAANDLRKTAETVAPISTPVNSPSSSPELPKPQASEAAWAKHDRQTGKKLNQSLAEFGADLKMAKKWSASQGRFLQGASRKPKKRHPDRGN